VLKWKQKGIISFFAAKLLIAPGFKAEDQEKEEKHE